MLLRQKKLKKQIGRRMMRKIRINKKDKINKRKVKRLRRKKNIWMRWKSRNVLKFLKRLFCSKKKSNLTGYIRHSGEKMMWMGAWDNAVVIWRMKQALDAFKGLIKFSLLTFQGF